MEKRPFRYAGNIFRVVAVVFTPYLGVKLLPDIKPVEGGHVAIYDTPRYRLLRSVTGWTVARKKTVVLGTVAALFIPLTFSVFWGSLAFTLIGGTIGETALTLVFLPALYAIWFRIGTDERASTSGINQNLSVQAFQMLARLPYCIFCCPAGWKSKNQLALSRTMRSKQKTAPLSLQDTRS